MTYSLRTADAFPVVASLPPKKEATTGNAFAVRRLCDITRGLEQFPKLIELGQGYFV